MGGVVKMYFIEIKNGIITGRAYGSAMEGMVEITKNEYEKIKSIPSNFETDEDGKIISATPIDIGSEEEPSDLELLGQEVTNLKVSNIQKDIIINQIGQELTNIKLKLIVGGGNNGILETSV